MKSYSIDTRTLKPGDIYIALKGENHDGHDFVAEAFKQGAKAAIVQNSYRGSESNLIRVFDTLKTFQDLAHEHLLKMPAKRVALTGSTGKTTTKELIAAACQACLGPEKVFFSTGNLNNHIGLPLSALNLKPQHQVAIFEMGMNHFGEIACLAKIVEPHIGLITNMGTAHGGNLGGIEGVAKAKAELFEALSPQSIGIINLDNPRCIREAQHKLRGQSITFGLSSEADVQISNPKIPSFCYQNQAVSIQFPLLGTHNIENAAAALAVAVALGLDFKKAAQALEQVQAIHGRLKKYTLKNGCIILDDTYNANPDSMKAGLEVLSNFKNRRKIAILGDMAELGNSSSAEHQKLGQLVREQKIDLFFACGPQAQAYGANYWKPDSETLATFLTQQDILHPSDVIWVKGSRSMQMNKVIDKLHINNIHKQC